ELVAESPSTISAGATFTKNITIPANAPVGDLRMRIRVVEGSTSFDSCDSKSYGEAEDYKVTIFELSNCSGTPESGTASLNPITGNPGSTFTATTTGATLADGIEYQWQKNVGG